jgi:hypothetical protein
MGGEGGDEQALRSRRLALGVELAVDVGLPRRQRLRAAPSLPIYVPQGQMGSDHRTCRGGGAAGPLRRQRVLVSQDGGRPGHQGALAGQDEVRHGHGCRPADVTKARHCHGCRPANVTRLGIVMVVDRQA